MNNRLSDQQIRALKSKFYIDLGLGKLSTLSGEGFDFSLRNQALTFVSQCVSKISAYKQGQWIAKDMFVKKLCDIANDPEYYYYSKDMLTYFVRQCDKKDVQLQKWQVRDIKEAQLNWGIVACEKYEGSNLPLVYNWSVMPLAELLRYSEKHFSTQDVNGMFGSICEEIDDIRQDGDLFFDTYDRVVEMEEDGKLTGVKYIGANLDSDKAPAHSLVDQDTVIDTKPTGQGDDDE